MNPTKTGRITARRHTHHLKWKSCWKLIYVDKYNSINNAWTSLTNQMVRTTSQAPFSYGNHSGHHSTSLMERIHTIGQNT